MKFDLNPINDYLKDSALIPGTTRARYDSSSVGGQTELHEERVVVYNISPDASSDAEVELLRFNVFGTQIREDHGFDQEAVEELAFMIREVRK